MSEQKSVLHTTQKASAIRTDPICLLDSLMKNGDEMMILIAKNIEGKITDLIQSAKANNLEVHKIQINWINRFDAEKNPDGHIGHFRILAFTPPSQELLTVTQLDSDDVSIDKQ